MARSFQLSPWKFAVIGCQTLAHPPRSVAVRSYSSSPASASHRKVLRTCLTGASPHTILQFTPYSTPVDAPSLTTLPANARLNHVKTSWVRRTATAPPRPQPTENRRGHSCSAAALSLPTIRSTRVPLRWSQNGCGQHLPNIKAL